LGGQREFLSQGEGGRIFFVIGGNAYYVRGVGEGGDGGVLVWGLRFVSLGGADFSSVWGGILNVGREAT